MKHDSIKQNGVHYTPPRLASFLARTIFESNLQSSKNGSVVSIDVLDPACGDGGLLTAITEAMADEDRKRLRLFGFERDPVAADQARRNLANLRVQQVEICERDFLDLDDKTSPAKFDIVIANPPYVRTQVIGSERAQELGKRYGLTGRVDLSHAFAIAMSGFVKERGTLGLLTSNRFLTIKSGVELRRFLSREFRIRSVIDLGDTKLFTASVLPVIVVATKYDENERGDEFCRHDPSSNYVRVYECRNHLAEPSKQRFSHVLDAISDPTFDGSAETEQGIHSVQRGTLGIRGQESVWSLSTAESELWLSTVESHQFCTFADVANIRVGIKTTADSVFIRDDWGEMKESVRPESDLLYPLITHHVAQPWSLFDRENRKTVLYPHEDRGGKRSAIELSRYPNAEAYLRRHQDRLRSRKYIADGGREWFEIWVAHQPSEWGKRKVVFPDISERPTFFLDTSGAIVNGDCYWMTLKPGVPDDWLYLILAFANSALVAKFYDIHFHNKLYSGRRRFMTQYVKQFPLPDLDIAISHRLVRSVKRLLASECITTRDRYQSEIERMVDESFGVGIVEREQNEKGE